MTGLRRGLVVAVVQVLLAASLGGWLLVDRARLPRTWARAVPVDPDLPIRGRYVELRLVVATRDLLAPSYRQMASLAVENGRLVAAPALRERRGIAVEVAADGTGTLVPPVAFFIPEEVADPSLRAPGEELWAEVTVPRRGPPRPIRLGVRRAGEQGPPVPIELR